MKLCKITLAVSIFLSTLFLIAVGCDESDSENGVESAINRFCDKVEQCDLFDKYYLASMTDCQTDYYQIGDEKASCALFNDSCAEIKECLDDYDDEDSGTEDVEVFWEYEQIPGAKCRNNTTTGIGVRYNPRSPNLAIFMDGGGACATPSTCLQTPFKFDEKTLERRAGENSWELYAGIFNPENSRNPIKDWNFVYIPYCTGDMHMGNKPDASIIGLPMSQEFVGYSNLQLFFKRVEELFPPALTPKVLLMGMSAGGFGSLVAYPVLAERYPLSEVLLVDDSGPLLRDDDAYAPCFQRIMRSTFNINPSIPAGCTECIQENGDGTENLMTYLPKAYPHGRFALFSTMEDISIRGTFGPGQNNCLGAIGIPPYPLPKAKFRKALIDMRDNVLLPTGKWTTFFVEGTTHGILPYEWVNGWSTEASYFDTHYNGVFFTEWMTDFINGGAQPVGPTE